MVDILYILKDKLLPIKGVPRKAEFIQQNRTEQMAVRFSVLLQLSSCTYVYNYFS